MAVYRRGYEPYEGALTPEWGRFLVIARQAYRGVFDSKLLVTFFALCFLGPIVYAVLIYLPHNEGAIALFQSRKFLEIDASFFHHFLALQTFLGFILTVFIGPGLVASDLANNALPLYFCRPFSRVEYVTGKIAVLAILLSAITWVPGLALFVFQSKLEGAGWSWDNLYIARAIFFGSWVWILLVSLLALALSAWVKWRLVAGALILASVFVSAGIGEAVHKMLDSELGSMLNVAQDIDVLLYALFRMPSRHQLSLDNALAALAAVCALCLYLLWRKIRAYEVERS